MFKTAFASALVAVASAQTLQSLANQASASAPSQSLQSLADQVNEALAPILNQENPVVQHGNDIHLNINNFEWSLAEYGHNFEFSVTELSLDYNNLQSGLAAFLTNTGNLLTQEAQSITNMLQTEAADLGIDFEGQEALAQQTGLYGALLTQNADSIAATANANYQKSAEDFATNKNGITTQTNQQIKSGLDNQETLSNAVGDAIDMGLENTGAYKNFDGLFGAASLSNSQAIDSLTSEADQVSALSKQGVDAGAKAALDNNLPSGLVGAAQEAGNNAAAGTSTLANTEAVNSAASSVKRARAAGKAAVTVTPVDNAAGSQ